MKEGMGSKSCRIGRGRCPRVGTVLVCNVDMVAEDPVASTESSGENSWRSAILSTRVSRYASCPVLQRWQSLEGYFDRSIEFAFRKSSLRASANPFQVLKCPSSPWPTTSLIF